MTLGAGFDELGAVDEGPRGVSRREPKSGSGHVPPPLMRSGSVRRRRVVGLLVALFSALITYPPVNPYIGWGLDQSWAAALHMAQHQGLLHGRDLVFTYGPLGWISAATTFYEGTGAIAIGIRFPILVAVAYLIWMRLRALVSAPFAVVGCVALSWLIGSLSEATLLVVLGVIAAYLARLGSPASPPVSLRTIAASGTLAAVMLVVKFDTGVSVAAWTAFVVVAEWLLHRQPVRRASLSGLVALGSFSGALVLLWVLTGQQLRYLGSWLEISFGLFFGFNDAMALPGAPWELQLAFASMAALAVLMVQRQVTLEPRRRLLLWIALSGAAFVFAKQGFLRHDTHSLRWWSFVAVAVLVLAVRRTVVLGSFVLVPSMIVAGTVAGGFSFTSPTASVRAVDLAAGQVVSSGQRRHVRENARRLIPQAYPIPGDIVAAIQGQTLHVAPVRAVVAWVYPATVFRPFPILQHYHGFTPKLDRWTADALRGPRSPRYVLYERTSVDSRIDRWEPPETMVAMLCRYRFVSGNETWQLFERRARDACGARRRIDVVEGRMGEELFTPLGDDNELVVGGFAGNAFSPGFLGRIRAFVSRPAITDVIVSGDGNRRRFVAATASQDHVLVLPACLRDQMAGFDTSTSRSLTFTQRRGGLAPGGKIEASFAAIAFDCTA